MKKITKALVPVAGFATRFLPASKTIPKQLFPVIDKPIILLIVEQLVAAGITDINFIISPLLPQIKSFFEPAPHINALLERGNKQDKVEMLKKIEGMADFHYVNQKDGRYGTGIALLSGKELIGDEPFLWCWGDEFFKADPPWLSQLIEAYYQVGGSMVTCIRRSDDEAARRYGFMAGDWVNKQIMKASYITEKPGIGNAPSDMAILTGEVLQPEIFDYLEKLDRDLPEGKEMYHRDAQKVMVEKGESIYGFDLQNYKYYDMGEKISYLKAQIELGLESEEVGELLRVWLKEYVKGL